MAERGPAGAAASDPRHQAGPVLSAASTGPRKVVHTVLDAAAAAERTLDAVHSAGSDLVTIRVPVDGSAPELTLQAVSRAVEQTAAGLRFDGVPDEELVVQSLARGITYLAGGPLRTVATGSGTEGLDVIEAYRRVDALVAAATDRTVVREIAPPWVVAPPPALLTFLLADLVLSWAAGVRSLVVSYPATGNLVQDVAAVGVLRTVAGELSAELGVEAGAPGESQLFTSISHWSGRPDPIATNRYAIAAASTMVAGLADVSQVVVGALGAVGAPSDSTIADGVSATRQLMDMLVDQRLEPSPQLAAARAQIDAAVRANLDLIRGCHPDSLPAAIASAHEQGRFGPGQVLRRPARAARDDRGAVAPAGADDPAAWAVWTDEPLPTSARR